MSKYSPRTGLCSSSLNMEESSPIASPAHDRDEKRNS